MSWFKKSPSQEKYVEAAITVASNLYLITIPEAEDAPNQLEFSFSDSRYRYFLFCLSTVFSAALAYDEKKQIRPEALFDGCVRFATLVAVDLAEMYFTDPTNIEQSIADTQRYFGEFLKEWSVWPPLETAGRSEDIQNLISRMIHTTESDADITDSDMQRLSELALDIDCRLPAMHGAFIELANR